MQLIFYLMKTKPIIWLSPFILFSLKFSLISFDTHVSPFVLLTMQS